MIGRAALGTAVAMAAVEMTEVARTATTPATTPATAKETSRGRLRTTFSPQTSAVTTVWERLQLHQGNLLDDCFILDQLFIRPGV